jgi:hypothetical protein
MKKMYVLLTGLCLLCVSAVNVKAADDIKTKIIGKWEISVQNAPEEFQKFNAEFKLKDGAVAMSFKGGDIDVKDQKFTEKDGKLSANIYVGEYVKITIWEEKGVMKGTAETSMGPLPFTMKKVVEKKN